MKTLKTGNVLGQMCRLCLSRDMTMDDIFCFCPELGKEIADIIMECAPVQITKCDEMPTYICQICFNQLKKFHQFQTQIVRSDKKLQSYLQQLNDCHPQRNVDLAHEEQVNNSESQNYNADVAAKCEPFEINDELDNLSSKQKMHAKFSSVNKNSEEMYIKSEIKDEPMDDDYLIPEECVDTVETLPTYGGVDVSCENSLEIDKKVEIENDMAEKIALKSEETYISGTLCSENVTDVECLPSIEDILNRTEHSVKNLNKKSQNFRSALLKKSTPSTRVRSHQCDVCQKYFSQGCHLRRHKLIHTGEKPYQCDICQARFRELGSLKQHNLTHTGEKPHQCDVCQMRFSFARSLKRHHLLHTGEKPQQCDICEKRFRELETLKKHIVTHKGKKPLQCDICKMCFGQEISLKRHKLIHTGEKP